MQILAECLPDITESINWNLLRNKNYAGFADFYLDQTFDSSMLKNVADLIHFEKLVDIDLKLGTQITEELSGCLVYAMRTDLIEVFVPIWPDKVFKICYLIKV